MADVVLCCCCGGFEATEPNGLCEYCVVMCFSPRSIVGCRIVESLREAERRGFPCSFYADVVCSHKKSVKFVVLGACFKCRFYRKFMREKDREEDEFFEEADKIRREGKWE